MNNNDNCNSDTFSWYELKEQCLSLDISEENVWFLTIQIQI